MTGVVTLTASAAIDRTYRVAEFVRGSVNRADSVHEELSGKGVNVAGALDRAGVSTRAIVPLGTTEIARFGDDPYLVPVLVGRPVRINISLLENDGTSTKVNQQPSPLDRSEWDALVDAGLTALQELGGGWLAICGSLPQLSDTGQTVPFEQIIGRAKAAGTRVAADLSGDPLKRVCAEGLQVDLIKPNTHELADAVGRELLTIGDVVEAAENVRARGVGTVYVSMGADGALVVGDDGYRRAIASAPSLINTVGAGDASLAGFLSRVVNVGTLDREVLDQAALAAASWGALSVSQGTTMLFDPATAPQAQVSRPPLATALSEPGLPQTSPRKEHEHATLNR